MLNFNVLVSALWECIAFAFFYRISWCGGWFLFFFIKKETKLRMGILVCLGKYQPLSADSEHMMDVQTPNPVSPSKPVLSTTTSKTAVLSPAGLRKSRRTLESFSCDFESGPCGWTLSGDTLNWTLHSGSVLSVGTGPSHDFTLGHCNASREGKNTLDGN